MKNLSILIVDDDPVIRRLVEQRLLKADYTNVETAENGITATQRMEKNSFDVILTDLMMPGGIGGIEVLEAAKRLHPDTEVVLITAHSSVNTAVEAMKKGAIDYLEKPINFDELYLRLDKIASYKSLIKDTRDLEQAHYVTEATASQTIQELEMKVTRIQECINQMETILRDQTKEDATKIREALDLIADR